MEQIVKRLSSGDKVDIDRARIERHRFGQHDPAHSDVVRVFSGEVQDLAAFDAVNADRNAEGDVGRNAQGDRGFAGAGGRGHRVDETPLDDSVEQVVGGNEPLDELGRGENDPDWFWQDLGTVVNQVIKGIGGATGLEPVDGIPLQGQPGKDEGVNLGSDVG